MYLGIALPLEKKKPLNIVPDIVVQWLALTPHSKKVPDSSLAQAFLLG